MERWPAQKGVSPSSRERRSSLVRWVRRVFVVSLREEPDFTAARASVNVYSGDMVVVSFFSFFFCLQICCQAELV